MNCRRNAVPALLLLEGLQFHAKPPQRLNVQTRNAGRLNVLLDQDGPRALDAPTSGQSDHNSDTQEA